ncbi:MAG: GGDEF domain-containing protein [Actinomycetota bacterium]|nr:GGDEF domain-containing protein [Actinomycetota bacterium]
MGSSLGNRATDPRSGKLTLARTLELTSGLVLLAFVAFMFASYLSVQSIDESFDDVVSIDQPSSEAAAEMIQAADETTIAFLESLVTDKIVPSGEAEDAFNAAMVSYETLARNSSADDSGDLERHLFGGLKQLGARLVADDQRRRRSFIAVQQRLEDMDERVSQIKFLSPFEGDVEENARLVSNYAAAPSLENSERSLEELDELIGELVEAVRAGGTKTERAELRAVLGQTREFKQIQVRIISLTERSENAIPRFLSARSKLDRVLSDGIERTVETSLKRQSEEARRTVERSKLILVASLVLGVILGLAALLWVRRRITHPVARLMAVIGGGGETRESNEVDLARKDEFGVLARAFADATTLQKVLEEELRRQALHDPLTELPNRTLFKKRVEQALNRPRQAERSFAVAFVDIDDFKTINDSLGHAAGDELLVTIAQRLRESVRTSDTPARLGGDEFAVLLEDVDDAAEVAIPAQQMLESVFEPIELEGKVVSVRGSVGIAIHQDGQGAGELLRNADVAMYSAKIDGKGRYKVFDQTMRSVAVH